MVIQGIFPVAFSAVACSRDRLFCALNRINKVRKTQKGVRMWIFIANFARNKFQNICLHLLQIKL